MRLACALVLLTIACLLAQRAEAEGYCPSIDQTAIMVPYSSYDVKLTDGCQLLVLTAAVAVTVTLPDPTETLPAGWTVGIKRIGGAGATVIALNNKTIDNLAAVSLSDGSGLEIYTDRINYFALGGLTGGGGGGTIPPPIGGVLVNRNSLIGTVPLGSSLSLSSGFLDFTNNSACFNLGPWSGDLVGAACASPFLSSGAASRNIGVLGGDLQGSLPNPSLVPSSVVAALGAPAGDVKGTSFAATLVTGLQGFPIAATPPTSGSTLQWNGSVYSPAVLSPGINQTTGDVTCGPGTGVQPCLISPQAVTNSKLANASPMTVKCNPGVANGPLTDCAATGGLTFAGGALQLAPTGVSAQQITVGSNCWAIGVDGRITGIAAGACNSGASLTADDGATAITADDGVTAITADGGGGVTACTASKYAFNVACNAALFQFRPI